jgi:Domain of unknown function (DUF4150)
VGTEVFANGSEIACQSGAGQVIAAFPDPCLSPPSPPAGPLPVPYPDTSASKDMQSGSTMTQIQGGPVMLKDQSFYKTSPLGNEAATNTFGGGLVTSIITGETYFIGWSPDVQFEGANVDRHLDMATSNHSGANPFNVPPLPNTSSRSNADIPKPKELRGMVTEVIWDRSVKITYADGSIAEPNWSPGLAVEDGGNEKIDGTKDGKLNGSNRPGIYLVGGKGANTVKLKVKITENLNVSGDATLIGVLGGFQMEGPCPTAAGEHSVTATIKKVPDSVQWFRGDVGWGLNVPDMEASIALENPTRLEVFVVLDTPMSFYTAGVWTEALRFLCGKVGVVGSTTPKDVAAIVTAYCHSHHTMKYDTVQGKSKNFADNEHSYQGGNFLLHNYILIAQQVVNCYDQAGAVQSLCGAVGVKIGWLFLQPFGFINDTHLIGVPGLCNNPFFSAPWYTKTPHTDINDPRRSSFGNHAFCDLASEVYDACAKPHVGGESHQAYCQSSIDYVTTLYTAEDPAGMFYQIWSGFPGVTALTF